MEHSFRIIVSGQFQYQVKRRHHDGLRLFSDSEEALAYIQRRLQGEPVEVHITNQLTGSSHTVRIVPASALPEAAAA